MNGFGDDITRYYFITYSWQQEWIDEWMVVAQNVQIHEGLLGLRLKEFVTTDGNWNWEMLQGWFPEWIIQLLAGKTSP